MTGLGGFLNEAVRLVYVQFSFSNREAVPQGLRFLPQEKEVEHKARKAKQSAEGHRNEQFIAPTEKVLARALLSTLERAGYNLVDATYQHRWGQKGRYHMVRYVFAQEAVDHGVHPDFVRLRSVARINLMKLLLNSFWRVRGYRNTGEEGSMVSINFESRIPIVDANGNALLVWKRDKDDNKVGDGPVPLEPLFTVFVNGSKMVSLRPYTPEIVKSRAR